MIYFLFYVALFPLMRLLMRVLGRVRSTGEQHVPMTGPVIFCPNHLSDCDPVVFFVTAPRRPWFLAKSELFDIPVLGWFMFRFHGIPIKPDSADRTALKKAESLLKRGKPLVIFPEGRLSEDGKLQRIQPGAALLSVRTGAPIVPVGFQNTDQIVPYGSLTPRFSRDPVIVTFGPPILPQEFAALPRSQAIEAVTQKLRDEIARLTHQF